METDENIKTAILFSEDNGSLFELLGMPNAPISEQTLRNSLNAAAKATWEQLAAERNLNAAIEVDIPEDPEFLASLNDPAQLEEALKEYLLDGKPKHKITMNAEGILALPNGCPLEFAFPYADGVLESVDGRLIGVNSGVMNKGTVALRVAGFTPKGDVPYFQLDYRHEVLLTLCSILHNHQLNGGAKLDTMLETIEFALLCETFEAAAELRCSDEVLETLIQRMEKRCPAKAYVHVYHIIKFMLPKRAENMWRRMMAEFYRLHETKTVGLLTLEEFRAAQSERMNISLLEEIPILNMWQMANRGMVADREMREIRRITVHTTSIATGEEMITRRRSPYSVFVALGGWAAAGPSRALEVLDSHTEQWLQPERQLCELPTPRCYFESIYLPKWRSFYVVGGFDGHRYYEGSVRFSLDDMIWDDASFATMSERRCYVNAAALGDSVIVAAGGFDSVSRLATAELFDANTNKWSPIASMNCIRSDAHAVELNGNIYVVGGFDGQNCHQTVEYYDPNRDEWKLLEREMKERRSGVTALSIHGVLTACGGFTGRRRLGSMEFYDPREGIWHSTANMLNTRSNFGMAELRGNPIVVGGYDGQGTTERCERFEWRANRWTQMPNMRFRRSALSLFRMDNIDQIEQFVRP